jgi:hypothetical protein
MYGTTAPAVSLATSSLMCYYMWYTKGDKDIPPRNKEKD